VVSLFYLIIVKTHHLYQHGNKLLSLLSPSDWQRWSPFIKIDELQKDQVLFNERKNADHVYFPVTCIVSMQYPFEDGDMVGYAQVGHEGMVGIHAFMASQNCLSTAVVMVEGLAYKIPMQWMQNEFNSSPIFRQLLMVYLQYWLMLTSRNVVCNRKHSIEQQLARTLLVLQDKASGNVLSITQETLAQLLGVRREGVSMAASHLQKLGAISYIRGQLTVLDRALLQSLSCECYEWLQTGYACLMNKTQGLGVFSSLINQEPSH
jgi:CRP-like cAMP-binding protein